MIRALNIGCGPQVLPSEDGWTNIDIAPYAGVDLVIDVVDGLPFREIDYIFAEHFIEHLTIPDAMTFLSRCRHTLGDSGVLRLSTPNLDWVWLTHYAPRSERSEEESLQGCLEMNRAFHGWGHHFVYNFEMLRRLLVHVGFRDVIECGYGESLHAALRGLERHERATDHPDAPHVVIVEASGRLAPDEAASSSLTELLSPYLRDFDVT